MRLFRSCVCVWCATYLKNKVSVVLYGGYLSTSTGTPRAASCVATDCSCEPGLQQLLSPGVQAVQLLHGAWHKGINSIRLDTYFVASRRKQRSQVKRSRSNWAQNMFLWPNNEKEIQMGTKRRNTGQTVHGGGLEKIKLSDHGFDSMGNRGSSLKDAFSCYDGRHCRWVTLHF